ncbi:Zinc import ATP-binding protein ZnuC [Vibrio stylophorae]|uniref:Zinc import ATP-binding protein ZnuC n=1 Tax=Vibrio stylophorae TaxID=659351 RepID=A0ABN8DRX8_9VIBR|nr:zinc ABC transporter ATP-binding protein ZnuC [Vibrio stylophorae]CAH0533874.1 Zinc import ATP-binding protein ZnuC [Vibrio stylophorae]
MTKLLSLERVSVNFSGRDVLDDISFDLNQGEITTLIGPNGAGKSTLVKTVLGLQKPTQGKVRKHKKLKIGYVPQKMQLNDALPLIVERFLRLVAKPKLSAEQALAKTGAGHLLQANMHSLSGGEMQRVLLARALMLGPNLLVLDEPLQGVDVQGQIALYELIGQLRHDLDCAILMVSHDLHLVMAKTDHVICLQHHICCSGGPEAVSTHPKYLALFGHIGAEQLALYHHQHNHQHDLAGQHVCQHKHH